MPIIMTFDLIGTVLCSTIITMQIMSCDASTRILGLDLLLLAEKTPNDSFPVVHMIKSKCTYYHYLCDEVDDRAWGCGYRSLQTLCSWANNTARSSSVNVVSSKTEQPLDAKDTRVSNNYVPTLRKIQETLVEVGDKPQSFIGSREWIGSFEACIVLDHLFNVPCKIVHVSRGCEVVEQIQALRDHFEHVGSPVMIGGDVDGASKTLIGIATDPDSLKRASFLIADPHYNGPPDMARIIGEQHVGWHGLDLFQDSSFYNFCIPQFPSVSIST